MKIVIAEDEARSAEGLVSLVEKCGPDYQVVGVARDGKEALHMIAELHPDVCITDIRMPVMDGVSLIREARSNGSAVHFIIVSAYEEFEVARQAISLGVEGFLVKPVMKDDVSQILSAIARGKRPIDLEQAKDKDSICSNYPDLHPTIRKALLIIEDRYGEKISQKELAESLGVTQEYFSSLFSQNVGESFARFLRRYRIGKAKEFLESGASTEEAAGRCGIGNVKYFSQLFRDETGVSPTEYRRNTEGHR